MKPLNLMAKNRNGNLRGAAFPREFKHLFKLSGLTLREIAKEVNISYNRLERLMYSNSTAMDQYEFQMIKAFCETVRNDYHCLFYDEETGICKLWAEDICFDGFVFDPHGLCRYPHILNPVQDTCDHYATFKSP